MALQTICDETDNSKTARVFGGQVASSPRYFSYLISSATASGAIYAGAGVLHSVVMGASAAGSILALYNGTTAAAIGSDLAITELQLGTQQPVRIYDAIFSAGLTFRLSAVSCPGVVVTYSKD